MFPSQVQEPQRFDAPGPIHALAGAPAINTSPKLDDKKHSFPSYGRYSSLHPGQSSLPQPSVAEMDSHGKIYGMPLTFPTGFQPVYFGLPGNAPLPLASIPNASPDVYQHGNIQHNLYQTQQLPHLSSPPLPPPIPIPEGTSRAEKNSRSMSLPSQRRFSPISSSQIGFGSYVVRPKDAQLSKRTKVSRACDECRRKKTRCDVDADHEVCTPCARSSVPCTFARAQLKRGPAKKRLSHGSLSNPQSSPTSHTFENISLASVKASARKSRSSSDVARKGLPPIEALLGYQAGTINGELANNQSADTNPSSAPKPSGFPMLVEVACRQSESPSEQEIISKPQSPLLQTVVPQTPPMQYDAGFHGVSHNALMEYYTFTHPTFPLLPDLVADFDAMVSAAGPSKEHLKSALNGTSKSVPFGLGNSGSSISSEARETHLIALLLTYLRTLDSAWLGASVAACTALMTSGLIAQSASSIRLTALTVIFDRIHCGVFDTPSLLPVSLMEVAQTCKSLQPTLKLLGISSSADSIPDDQFVTIPRVTLSIFGRLAQRTISLSEAQKELQLILPQLQRTPLEPFASALLAR